MYLKNRGLLLQCCMALVFFNQFTTRGSQLILELFFMASYVKKCVEFYYEVEIHKKNHCKKNLLKCCQLWCRRPRFPWVSLMMRSDCAWCTVIVHPRFLGIQPKWYSCDWISSCSSWASFPRSECFYCFSFYTRFLFKFCNFCFDRSTWAQNFLRNWVMVIMLYFMI